MNKAMAEVAELMKEEEKVEEAPKAEEWPQVGDWIWKLACTGKREIFISTQYDANFYKSCLELTGNIFRIEEEAELADQARTAITKIKNYARQQWGEFKPDWGKRGQNKWGIGFWGDSQRFETIRYLVLNNFSPIGYFQENKHADEIIKKFPEELGVIRRFYT